MQVLDEVNANTTPLLLVFNKIFCLLETRNAVIMPLRRTGLPVFPFRGAKILEA